MLPSERLAFGYFALVAGLALFVRMRRRWQAVAAAAGFGACVLLAGRLPAVVRDWLPHVYLVGGYWVPALLVTDVPATRFERWLAATDRAVRPRLPALPPAAANIAELAYLLCYPLVPLSFTFVWWWGTPEDVTRFWLTTLLAGYICYITLPWLLSRPPRFFDPPASLQQRVRALNALVLGRVSHEWNTFPSGHVAVSCAAAWSLAHVSRRAGVLAGLAAVAVAAGAAAGRYHYVVDVLAGVLVAAAVAVITW